MVTIIVAYCEDMTIGVNGVIPWDLPEDRKFFKRTTIGHPVIMGRKTWDSLNHKPLKGRLNVVLTKQNFERFQNNGRYDGNVVYSINIDEALYYSTKYNQENTNRTEGNPEVFVIGGAQIYKEFLDKNLVDKLIITHVTGKYDGGEVTKFPMVSAKFDWTNILMVTKEFITIEYKKGQAFS